MWAEIEEEEGTDPGYVLSCRQRSLQSVFQQEGGASPPLGKGALILVIADLSSWWLKFCDTLLFL